MKTQKLQLGVWGVFAQVGFKVWDRIPQIDKLATSQICPYLCQIL